MSDRTAQLYGRDSVGDGSAARILEPRSNGSDAKMRDIYLLSRCSDVQWRVIRHELIGIGETGPEVVVVTRNPA